MKTLDPIDISKLLSPYAGKWVALNRDETKVIGSGATVEDAIHQAKENGEDHPIVIKAPDQYSAMLL